MKHYFIQQNYFPRLTLFLPVGEWMNVLSWIIAPEIAICWFVMIIVRWILIHAVAGLSGDSSDSLVYGSMGRVYGIAGYGLAHL